MSDNTIPSAVDGTIIPASDHNSLRTSMLEDIVPRNASAVATDQAGSVGTSTYTWLDGWMRNIYALTKLWIGAAIKNNTIETNGTDDIDIKRGGVVKLRIEANGISGSYLKDDNLITQAKLFKRTMSSATASTGNVAISASCASFSTASTSYVDVTNLSVTLTTTGRPVFVGCIPAGSDFSSFSNDYSGVGSRIISIQVERDTTVILYTNKGFTVDEPPHIVPYSISTVDIPSAGTYTYTVSIKSSGNGNARASYLKLIAYEL